MILAEVTGRIWNERAVSGLEQRRLVTVRPVGGTETLVAVDLIHVAAPNLVLLASDEAAQAAACGDAAGIDLAVVALVAGADVVTVENGDAGR
ncbi:EutN/CcmL family microcompartment protein [Streptosporangium sp. NPDC006013]|uniref:EutN/CcmL family microcompartment protein n=1 Tax=Streptosporangium sp. NPDC006013 TaxID=3155596 RepID=UPI0033B6B634